MCSPLHFFTLLSILTSSHLYYLFFLFLIFIMIYRAPLKTTKASGLPEEILLLLLVVVVVVVVVVDVN